MFRKFSFVLALFAALALPIVQSLNCYTCGNSISCRNPPVVTCDQVYANTTREAMKFFYKGVKDLNSNDYSCMISRYHANGTVKMDVRGCIMNGAVDCGFLLKNQTWSRDVCKVCRTDKCNFKNSVSAHRSSVATIIGLLVIAKAFLALNYLK